MRARIRPLVAISRARAPTRLFVHAHVGPLRASVDIAGYPPQARAVLQALKTYGMIVADSGSNWFISDAPDARWDDDDLRTLRQIRGRDFEVVRMGPIITD